MKCGKPATHTYVWANEVVKQCEGHMRQMQVLAQHMGWPMTVSLLNDGSLCESFVGPDEEGREDETTKR